MIIIIGKSQESRHLISPFQHNKYPTSPLRRWSRCGKITGLRLMRSLPVSWVYAPLSSIRQIPVFVFLLPSWDTAAIHTAVLSRTGFCWARVTQQIVPSDPVTISPQAGWAVTPASGPTGRSECYRAGSRWPFWCHTDSQIGFNCQGWSLAQWVCGGRGPPWVAGPKIEPDEERCDLTHTDSHAQHIFLTHSWMTLWWNWHNQWVFKASYHAKKKVEVRYASFPFPVRLSDSLSPQRNWLRAHTQADSQLRRPWVCFQWQYWLCSSNVSGQHCMSRPIYFCICSHRSGLLSEPLSTGAAFNLFNVYIVYVAVRSRDLIPGLYQCTPRQFKISNYATVRINQDNQFLV